LFFGAEIPCAVFLICIYPKGAEVEFLNWLQNLGRDANPAQAGFQASPWYVLMSVILPVIMGLISGYGLRFIERLFGVELGKGGRH
jgi:ABC-type molybdate transport system permease subunit